MGGNSPSANVTARIYIQYFWTKDFSGTGWTGAPSSARGGGVRKIGLE